MKLSFRRPLGASAGTLSSGTVRLCARHRPLILGSRARLRIKVGPPIGCGRPGVRGATWVRLEFINGFDGASLKISDCTSVRADSGPFSMVVEEAGGESFHSTPAESSDGRRSVLSITPSRETKTSRRMLSNTPQTKTSGPETASLDPPGGCKTDSGVSFVFRPPNPTNQRTAAVENQALQAVLEARGETAQSQAQSQVLAARFAGELQAANIRENSMRRELERLEQSEAQLRSEGQLLQQQLDDTRLELQATQARPSLALTTQSPNATGNQGPDDMRFRVSQCAATPQNVCEQLDTMSSFWNVELLSLRELVEQVWWEPQLDYCLFPRTDNAVLQNDLLELMMRMRRHILNQQVCRVLYSP